MTQVNTDGNHGLFLNEQLAHFNTGNTQKKVSNIASDEDIIKNNYMFVMLWNLSVIRHLIFLQWFLAPLAVGQRAYVMVCCPSCVRPCINFFFKHLLL